jgi:hypothetical protein
MKGVNVVWYAILRWGNNPLVTINLIDGNILNNVKRRL